MTNIWTCQVCGEPMPGYIVQRHGAPEHDAKWRPLKAAHGREAVTTMVPISTADVSALIQGAAALGERRQDDDLDKADQLLQVVARFKRREGV